MTPSARAEHFEPSDYLGVLRRRWWIVLGLACAGALLGGGYAKVAPKTYTATVLVQVNAVPNSVGLAGARTSGPVNMDNEAQIVQSLTIASLAAKQLNSPEAPRILVKQIAVSVPPNTTFLQISCGAPTARGAALCADAFGNAYISNRNNIAVSQVTNDINTLQAKITGLQDDIARYKTRLANLPANSPSRTTSELRVNEDTGAISSALTYADQDEATLANLDQPGNTAVGSIATPATPPTSPSSPRLLLVLPSGLLAGLVIGLLLAFFLDRRDPRIQSARDVERFLDVPVLLDASASKRDIFGSLASPRSEAGRAFSELAQYVALSLGDGNHVVLVVGTAAGSGGSMVAVNLAVHLARSRSDVILLTSGHSAGGPELVDAGDGRGLAEVLAGRAIIGEVARRSALAAKLRVVTPGEDASGGAGFQHDAYRRMMADARREARYVIIEAQSVGDDADAFMVSEFADAALAVVEVGQTRRTDALDCLHRLDRLHSSILGAAVVPASPRRPKAEPRDPKQQRSQQASSARAGADKPRPADPAPKDGANDGSKLRTQAAAPVTVPADRQADGDVQAAARGAAETWPLPRASGPASSDAQRRRTGIQNPADKTARG